jgi:AcrR family transcriptional regulator
MEKLKRNKRSKKREQIVRTAEGLFSRFGAKRVTVEEVCREAEVSKMTFYKYFPNKVELVRNIRDNWVEEGFRKFDKINAIDLPFPEKINLVTRWKVEFTTRVNAEFIRELVSTDDAIEQFKRRYLGNIKRAQEKGEVRSDIDPEFLWLVVEKLNEMVREGSWKSVFSKLGEYQHQLRILLWYGLLTRKEDEK